MGFAPRIEPLEPFLAMEVMERAFAMERAGTRVIHLEIGEPDFPPPPEAVEACQRALAEGQTHYSSSLGLPELREAIAEDHELRHGTRVDPERVLVTSGTSPAMLLVFALLVEEGDEVIIGAPHYPCYPNFIRVFGGRPVSVVTDPAEGYRLDPDAVRRALSPRTRAIVVGSPANPMGAVQDEATVRALAALGPPLISDEIYDGLVYDDVRVTSALRVSDGAFVLDGFSKRYAMTGFRLGYVIAPREAIRPLQILQQNLFISANRFVQHAGIAALRHGRPSLEAMRSAYLRRRAILVDGLRGLGFGVPSLPPGAFYVFADARAFDSDSRRLAFSLLESAHVAATPGIDFGPEGEGWLRFCYAASEAEIREAIGLLGEALPRLEAAGGSRPSSHRSRSRC
jgi:aspartate/methionine/tyrosine aminotransferase